MKVSVTFIKKYKKTPPFNKGGDYDEDLKNNLYKAKMPHVNNAIPTIAASTNPPKKMKASMSVSPPKEKGM